MSKRKVCHCQKCEVKTFEAYKARVSALSEEELKNSYDPGSRGMELIRDLHREVAERHPLGIGQVLHAVMTSVHIGERADALNDLDELIDDEHKSAAMNNARLDYGCLLLDH